MLADLLLSFQVEVYRVPIFVLVVLWLEILQNFRLEVFLQLRFDKLFGLLSNFLLHVAVLNSIQLLASCPCVGFAIVFNQLLALFFYGCFSYDPEVSTEILFYQLRSKQANWPGRFILEYVYASFYVVLTQLFHFSF